MISIETIKHWIALAAQLKTIKKHEMTVRKELAADLMSPSEIGTKHQAFGEIQLTVSQSLSISIDRETLLENMDILTDEEKECIQWKPSLIKANYNALPEDAYLRTLVTAKPSAPSVKAMNLEAT